MRSYFLVWKLTTERLCAVVSTVRRYSFVVSLGMAACASSPEARDTDTTCSACSALDMPSAAECSQTPCNGHGTCDSNTRQCVCDDGYEGPECDRCADGYSSVGVSCQIDPLVTLVDTVPCGPATCHTLEVSCEGLDAWGVEVREFEVDNPRGAIIFGTGGPGTSFYFDNSSRRTTRETVTREKLEIFEFRWSPAWFAAGKVTQSLKRTHCAYAETVKWIAAERAENPETMCAQGNSGGSFQIAYGLANYGLEELYDMVIMSGGPPLTRMDIACFGDDDSALIFPADLAGRQWIDKGMGWEEQAYCQNGDAPPEIHEALKDASIVSPTIPGDYDYPNTKANFVNSEGDVQGAFGHLMYDVITSDKAFYWIQGDVHEVDKSPAGLITIQDLIVNECW